MAISRRRFIKNGTLVALAAGLPLKVAAETIRNSGTFLATGVIGSVTSNGSKLDQDSFIKYLKSDFQLSGPGVATIRAKLIEVHDWKSQAKGPSSLNCKECFSAIFVASASAPLLQNTYTVEHTALGKFSMFLVPSRRSTNSIQYEAVFNRL